MIHPRGCALCGGQERHLTTCRGHPDHPDYMGGAPKGYPPGLGPLPDYGIQLDEHGTARLAPFRGGEFGPPLSDEEAGRLPASAEPLDSWTPS